MRPRVHDPCTRVRQRYQLDLAPMAEGDARGVSLHAT